MDPDLFFMYTFNAYDIQGRFNNSESRQLLVKCSASSKAYKPNYLLQVGLASSQGPRSNPQVAAFALNECLSAPLSSPVHRMYKQAYRITVRLKEGEFPPSRRGKVASNDRAWNRAAVPVRLGQIDLARKWMNVGLELAKQAVGMETYCSCMEDFISSFEKTCLELSSGKNRP